MSRRKTCAVPMLGAIAVAASAQSPDPIRIPQAELFARVAKTSDGLATSGLLPAGTHATALTIRRERSGVVEVHETKEDIFIAQIGHATVVVGTAEGMKATAPGEWRGGTITETKRYELAPGDILWIPAGLAHRMLLPAGKSFNYLALKFDTKPR